MTTEEFKKLKPEYKDAQGDELWDAMTMYMLRQQKGDEIIKKIKPIWKTHTFRWLFYRRVPNWTLEYTLPNRYTFEEVCSKCMHGSSTRFGIMSYNSFTMYCPKCHSEYIKIPNAFIGHKLYKIGKWIRKSFWFILDSIRLVRSSIHSRYEMFGDESRYVKSWILNSQTLKTEASHRKRKWWEYIIIEKPFHKF